VEAARSSQISLDFQQLHGVIYQKIEFFITTGVRSSKSTRLWRKEGVEA
jgi:hypothetical protein